MRRLILNKQGKKVILTFVRHSSRNPRYLKAKQTSEISFGKSAAQNERYVGRYRLSVVTTTPFVEDYDVVGILFAEANLPRPSPSFLRNPPVKISISTFRSLHRVPRGRIKRVHMLPSPPIRTGMLSSTSLVSWTRSSKMQQQSAQLVERTSLNEEGPTGPAYPRDTRGFSLSV